MNSRLGELRLHFPTFIKCDEAGLTVLELNCWTGCWWHKWLSSDAVGATPCGGEFVTVDFLWPRVTIQFNVGKTSTFHSLTKLSARLVRHSTWRKIKSTHEKGHLSALKTQTKIEGRMNFRGGLFLSTVIEQVRNHCHCVVDNFTNRCS